MLLQPGSPGIPGLIFPRFLRVIGSKRDVIPAGFPALGTAFARFPESLYRYIQVAARIAHSLAHLLGPLLGFDAEVFTFDAITALGYQPLNIGIEVDVARSPLPGR